MSVVNCVAYDECGRRVHEIALTDVAAVLRDTAQFVWVGLVEPDPHEIRLVQEEFGLHELAIEDALRAHQRPKVEEYGETLLWCCARCAGTRGRTASAWARRIASSAGISS